MNTLLMQEIKDILSSLPHSPGVYQFFNQQCEIIYVGKSKNLKSRVGSYFSGQQKLNFAKKKMTGYITDIKYIVTNNETESLILENDLIKKYNPKYNVLLKDDKNFLYIKITREEYPKVIRTRISPSEMKERPGKYFGPYISGYHVFEVFKILKKAFGYGVGPHNFFKKKGAYTLDNYLFEGNIQGQDDQIKDLYHKKLKEIQHFLQGNTGDLKKKLHEEMLCLAGECKFEEAQKRKLAIEALGSLDTYQVVRDGVSGDYIVMQVIEKYESLYLGVIDIEGGKIIGYENSELENLGEETKQEIILGMVERKWAEKQHLKKLRFILPSHIEIAHENIEYEVPEMGAKYDLLKLCYKNIYEYAHKKHIDSLSTKGFSKKNMQNLLELLGYKEQNPNIVFECNDISHLSGSHTVASRSIIEDGKKNPKKYKRFRIKTLKEGKIDDFASMREIMTRRLAEIAKVGNAPDLIIIDGGKGQLSAVMEILSKSDIELQIVSLAKREEELFLPGESQPIILKKDSQELRMVQAIRDEAHRFAISFNRDSRSKSQKKNVLESLPGIGPKIRKKILTKYGNITALKDVPKEEIQDFLGNSTYEILENHGFL